MVEWKLWVGKIIFVKLRSGEVYNGKVINSDDNFIEIMTKFNEHVVISSAEIIKVVDETNRQRGEVSP